MLNVLKKRYWLFSSMPYEPMVGLGDMIGSTDDLATAKSSFNHKDCQWLMIFDSHTGIELDYCEKSGEWKKSVLKHLR